MYDRARYTTTSIAAAKTLVRSDDTLKSRKATLVSGQNLVAGSVLGKITASGKYNLSASAAGDGSNTPDLILAHDADATGGDLEVIAYEGGDFIGSALTLGAGHTLASIREGLRAKGITFSV